MDITRRQFSQGTLAAAAVSALPPVSFAGVSGYDDAYAKILGEMCRIEEAAQLAGRSGLSSGAATWQGQQLENFLSALDARVDPLQTASEVFRELRDHLQRKAREFAEREANAARDAVASREDSAAEDAVDPQPHCEDDETRTAD